MENIDDVESYLKSKALLYPDLEPKPNPFVTISIDEMFSGGQLTFYKFNVYGCCVGICQPNNLFEHMQKIKKRYNEEGKAVVFV